MFTPSSDHSFSAQRCLFKAYDIRGERYLFTQSFIYALSHTFAAHLKRAFINTSLPANSLSPTNSSTPTIVVGHDMRHGSLEIATQFAQTLTDTGFNVIWLGLVTTPITAFWANEYDGHGVIATASHSEAHINGIKWLVDGKSPSSSNIIELYQSLNSEDVEGSNKFKQVSPPASNVIAQNATISIEKVLPVRQILTHSKVMDAYINSVASAIDLLSLRLTQSIQPHSSQALSLSNQLAKRPAMKVVIDCLNGATSLFSTPFFTRFSDLCKDLIVLNAQPDGDFPKGAPDPTEMGRLKELSQAVIEHDADIGLGFDGDGDRLMIVDNLGEVVAPDHLLYLLARVAIEDRLLNKERSAEPPTVLFDVKCSHHLPILIQQLGAVPQMSRTGSSILRKALKSKNKSGQGGQAIFAGELSGHFLFNDGLFMVHDDAMYAALRLLHWLNRQSHPLSELIKQLPTMVSTCDVYLPLNAYQSKPAQSQPLQSKPAQFEPSQNQVTKISPEITSNSHERPILNKLANLCNKLQKSCTCHSFESPVNLAPTVSIALIQDQHQLSLLNQEDRLGLPSDTHLTCIDGLRLDFNKGFGIIRASNTSNCLTVRFAADSLTDLQQVQHYFVNLCKTINADLAQHIANITVPA